MSSRWIRIARWILKNYKWLSRASSCLPNNVYLPLKEAPMAKHSNKSVGKIAGTAKESAMLRTLRIDGSQNGATLRTRVVRDKTKYSRNLKHKGSLADAGDFPLWSFKIERLKSSRRMLRECWWLASRELVRRSWVQSVCVCKSRMLARMRLVGCFRRCEWNMCTTRMKSR